MKNDIREVLILNLILFFPLFVFFYFVGTEIPNDTKRFISWINETKDFTFFESINYLFHSKGSEGIFFLLSFYIFKIINYLGLELIFIFKLINYIIFSVCISFIYLRTKINFKIYIPLLLLFLIFNFEFSQWLLSPLTEMLFFCLIFLIILSVANKKYFLCAFLSFVILFTKPSAINLFFVFLQILLIKLTSKNINNYFKIVILNIFFVIIVSSIIFLNINLPIIDGRIDFLNDNLKEGIVIIDRAYHNVNYDFNFFNTIKITIIKFIYFFKFFDAEFSLIHNFVNFFVFFPLYVISISLIFIKKISLEDQNIIFFNILFIVSFSVFHALTWIDYDWRYRGVIVLPLFYNMTIFLKYFSIKLMNGKN